MLVWKVLGTFCIILIFLHIVSTSNDTTVSSTPEWIIPAHKSMRETASALSAASGAFASYNEAKSSHILSTLTKKATRIAGFLGTFGAFIAAILALIPGGDSPELAFMKEEFGKTVAKN